MSRLGPLPKKVDLSDLNNWRGMNLLDVASKVENIILNARVQKLLQKNGQLMQFGATPSVGCAEAVFLLKPISQSRKENGIDSFVVFVDLVKSHDSIKHDVATASLEKMGAPQKFITWVEKLHENCNVNLKIGKEEVIIKHGCGVKQSDNLSPILFTIVMQLVIEDTFIKFKLNNLDLPRMKHDVERSRILKLHNKKEINKIKDKLTCAFTHADDGAFIFNDRESMIKYFRTTCDEMDKWGLTVHVGRSEKK